MNDNKLIGTRTFVGGLLVIVGILMFLSINEILDFSVGRVIFSWPFFAFIIGILILLNSRNRTLGVILVFVGGFFLIPRIFTFIDYDGSLVFPLLIIALGVYIIARRRQSGSSVPVTPAAGESRRDYIDDVAVFGGGSKVLVTDNFRGGNLTAVFGGSEVDLSRCRLAEGENVLDVLMVFGGTDIYVPKEWNVIVNVTPLFGGFSNKVIRDPALPIDTSRTLVIKGMALFGGGEVKNKF